MTRHAILRLAVLPAALVASSCGAQSTGDSAEAQSTPAPTAQDGRPFTVKAHGAYDEPWAAAFVPGTSVLVITLKSGKIMGFDTRNERAIFFEGVPTVDYGGQGGLGEVAFLPSEAASTLTPRTIYLSWVEAGSGDTRGAAVGKGRMVCEEHQTCRIDDLAVIWRQTPKVTGRGHFSHRITFSPDEKYMFVASGDRQKMQPAQDLSNTLGSVVRLTLDGQPAPGNPFAGRGSPSDQIWSYGHRNILGLKFDAQGRLWALEHGPRGGDELNLIERGDNYGWPVVSNGVHYGGEDIPDHSARPEFHAPAIGWTPVVAPGDFVHYSGKLWPEWRGDALIAAMKPSGLVRVEFDGTRAREVARYPFDKRIREIVEGPDGALWLLEDKEGGRLLELRPK